MFGRSTGLFERSTGRIVPMMAVLITRSERSAGSGHDPRIMGLLLYHVAVVARWFSDGDRRRATWGVVVVAGLVSIPPFLESVLSTVCQRKIHCGYPWVEFGAGTDGSELPSPRGGIALPACCLWISPSTLIQNFARSLCPPSAAARALFRATVAAFAPCTSIMSRASDGSSAPSVMTVASPIAASGEAALFPGEFNGTLEA